MLIKTIGIICLILTGIIMGWSFVRDYEERILNLKQFRKMLILLKGEMSYNNAGIRELLVCIARRNDNVIGDFLENVRTRFDFEDVTIQTAWSEATEEFLKEYTSLKESDRKYIKEFGMNLGTTDRDTQINNILVCMEHIELTIKELNDYKAQKCKMYKTLGVTVGAFLAILLI